MFRNLSPKALGISGRPSEIIELALSFGFKGIELDIADFAEQVKAHGLAHARRLIDSAKLRLGSFELPLEWRGGEEEFRHGLERLPELASLAAEVGCTRCVTWIDPASDQRPYHQNFEFHRQQLTDVALKLESLGVRLGIGFRAARELRQGRGFEFIHDLDALLMLLGMIGAKNVGAVLDCWDLRVSGGTAEAVARLTAQRIVEVRLANGPADAPPAEWKLADRMLPGEPGAIDVPALLGALAEAGYDGPLTPAPDARRYAALGREKLVRQAGQQLEGAWKAAGLTPAGKLATLSSARR